MVTLAHIFKVWKTKTKEKVSIKYLRNVPNQHEHYSYKRYSLVGVLRMMVGGSYDSGTVPPLHTVLMHKRHSH